MLSESIDTMCCQETEIKNNTAKENLTFPGFELEMENNNRISRVRIFIKTGLTTLRGLIWRGPDNYWPEPDSVRVP